jgi:hypothetical protein
MQIHVPALISPLTASLSLDNEQCLFEFMCGIIAEQMALFNQNILVSITS